jgi:predicted aspartyl protease
VKSPLLIALLLLVASAALAGVFSYRDENGTLHAVSSADEIPPQFRGTEKHLQGTESGTGEVNLKLERDHNSLLIPVTFGAAGEVLMVLDTGASVSMINSTIAEKAKAKQVGLTMIGTAGGNVKVPVVVMPETSVKQFTVKDLKITVNNIPVGSRAQGLLGVDFLNHFRMQLDTETGQLHLERK